VLTVGIKQSLTSGRVSLKSATGPLIVRLTGVGSRAIGWVLRVSL
jgi:hypothetical protein